MEKTRQVKIEQVFIIICAVALAVAFLNRLRFGAETSDEAYYIATGYRLLKGNVPFGDMWETSAMDAYIMLPFLFLRSLFVGDATGLLLYSRISFFILSFLGVWAVFTYGKKSIGREYALFLGLIVLFFAPFQLYNFSYNSLSDLFTIASLCMFFVYHESDKRVYSYLTGIFMAVAVMVYPTMIYLCFIVAVLSFPVFKPKKAVKFLLMYVAGGITVALLVLIHLSFTTDIGTVIKNLGIILSAESTPALSANRIFVCILDAIKYLKTPFVKYGIDYSVFWILVVLFAILKKTKIISQYLILFYPLICCYYAANHGVHTVMMFIFSTAFTAPVSILLADERKDMLKKCIREWGVSIVPYFIVAFSSGGAVANARHSLIFATVVSMKLIAETLLNSPPVKLKKICIYFMILSVVCSEVLLFYHGVYRDAKMSQLTTKAESGYLKGIYTTPDRKQHIENLEKVLSQAEDKDETVMVLYHSCYAYLMLDMLPKTPTTWGSICISIYGYTNEELFVKYLSKENNVPDNILIVDIPEEYDFAFQRKEFYESDYDELNQFIAEHYRLVGIYQKDNSGTVEKYEVNSSNF